MSYSKEYYQLHKEELKARSRENYKNNREQRIKQHKEWKIKNKEKNLQLMREWRKLHKEECRTKSQTNRNKKQEWLRELKKSLHCIVCGENRWWCLEFHHRDPSEKENNISIIINRWGMKRILEEIVKCDVFCANCHKTEHYNLSKEETK